MDKKKHFLPEKENTFDDTTRHYFDRILCKLFLTLITILKFIFIKSIFDLFQIFSQIDSKINFAVYLQR